MNPRLKKIILLVLAAALLASAGFLQTSMNRDRDELGLTHVEGLTNAPPVLAFTTVALGGFRGLISNMLWMRASELQENDKFFEMAQLSDWITKLEPHFSQVWVHEAWNMAYNISVKFKDFPDRWRWVQNGIALLRDEGLRYNPDDVLIHRELAWFFQHKMGANLDDASMYYKTEWKKEMESVLGKKPDFDALIHPQTAEQTNQANVLREKYKMDPVLMKKIDEQYGPLEWRLPEAHAIYWASQGLMRATNNPTKVKADDLIQLRRVVYQCMQLRWQRGRVVENPFGEGMDFGPNLDIIPKVNDTYLQMYEEETDPGQKDGILKAHRNFLRQAIYTLFVYNREKEAAKWFKYVGEKYPNKIIIDGDMNSFPRNVTLDRYVISCVQENINETSYNDMRALLEGLLVRSYMSLVMDEDDRAAGLKLLAFRAWQAYQNKIPAERMQAIGLPPFADIDRDVRQRILDPQNGLPPEARAILRTKLNLPKEEAAAPQATPAPTQSGTNAPANP
jgi:hypothetical protein